MYSQVDGVPVLLPEALSEQQASQTLYFDAAFGSYADVYAPENWRRSFIRRIFAALEVRDGGCDLSVPGVVHASRLARGEGVDERAKFVACTAEALPFPEAAFACVSSVAVLEHLDDDRRAARELARVVQPGGLVWVTVPLAYRYILPPLWPVYLRHDRKLGHKRHYDEAALVDVLGQAGLRHVETTYTGHAVKVLQLALDRLLPLSASPRDRLWWLLERLDLRAVGRPWGALQLNAVFRRDRSVAA